MRRPDLHELKDRSGSRQRSQRSADAAARAHLKAHLGWLTGVPLGRNADGTVRWATLPRPGAPEREEIISVDGERLRATEYGRNAARRRFPKALARVVGDVDTWSARVDRQLDILKRAVHHGAELPDLAGLVGAARLRPVTARRLRAISSNGPAFASLAEAFVWLYWHDEAEICATLDALGAADITVLLGKVPGLEGLTLLLRLSQLVAEGGDRAALERLCDPRIWEVPFLDGDLARKVSDPRANARESEGGLSVALLPRPEAKTGAELAGFVRALVKDDGKSRARQLQLVAALLPADLAARWEAWWTRTGEIERRARRHAGRYDHDERSVWWARWQEVWTIAREEIVSPPPEINWDTLGELIRCASAATPAAFTELAGCLDLLVRGEDGPVRAQAVLKEWAPEIKRRKRGPGAIARLIGAQRGLIGRFPKASPAQLDWMAGPLASEMVLTWIDDGKPQKLVSPMMEALHVLVADPDRWPERASPFQRHSGWDELFAAIEQGFLPHVAAHAIAVQQPVRGGLCGAMWLALLSLADGDARRLQRFAKAWPADDISEAGASELKRLTRHEATRAAIIAGLEHGEGRRVARLVGLSRLASALGVGARLEPLPAGVPAAFARYPGELDVVLAELARWDGNAEAAAAEIAGPGFAEPEHIEVEIAELRTLAGSVDLPRRRSLEVRIRNLEQRLASPVSISPKRLANIRQKLERRLAYARLARWEEALEPAVQAGLAGSIGFAVPAAWTGRPEVREIVAAVCALRPPFRALAFRLLGRGFGPQPWDLREEPRNLAFLDTLRARGLDVAPWLDGIAPVEVPAGSRTLTIGMELDPLEIMRMGAPFETCLSPRSFNFFSAVANAADINKRVLYARDGNGGIQGRCLLGLSNDGHIVTFSVYAHAHAAEITEGMRCYVDALARRMGTSATAHGVVALLVAPDWYDDGAIELTAHHAFLAQGSSFVLALDTIAAQDLVPRLERELGGAPITPSIVCAIARQYPVETLRPELILPLVPFLGDASLLDPWTRLRIVPLLRRAGDTAGAARMLDPLVRLVLRGVSEWMAGAVAEELLELAEPHRALTVIRRTANGREWRHETDHRALVAARALYGLQRPRRALELARISASSGNASAGALVKEIERELAGKTDGSVKSTMMTMPKRA